MRPFTICLVAGVLALLTSCGRRVLPPPTESTSGKDDLQIYSARGVVKELKPDGRTVVVRHEAITNYMPAMTMPLQVKDTRELEGLSTGDEITFRLLVTSNDGWIDQIRKIGATNVVEDPVREPFRRVRDVEPLTLGDPLPDYPFTNELGQSITLGQFKGNALGITFIFTRCPFPLFCPRLSGNFQAASKQLLDMKDGPKNWRLLSISFDPDFDTPQMLRAYARRYDYDPAHWSFATGALIEIDAITEQFGLMFPRNGALFDHNFRTVVIDADGKIQRVFAGNEWKVDDFVAEMVSAAKPN
jgi:protein SCO1/2